MTIQNLKYPVDFTGIRASNLIVGERYTVPRTGFRIVLFEHGPAFRKNLKVFNGDTNALLNEGGDYKLTWYFDEHTKRSARHGADKVYGALVLNTTTNAVSIKVDMQVLGSVYCAPLEVKNDVLRSALARGDFTAESLYTNNNWVDDTIYAEHFDSHYITGALSSIADAINKGNSLQLDELYNRIIAIRDNFEANYTAHLKAVNPHGTTAVSVGSMSNEEVASRVEEVRALIAETEALRLKALEDLRIANVARNTLNGQVNETAARIDHKGNAMAALESTLSQIVAKNAQLNELILQIWAINVKLKDDAADLTARIMAMHQTASAAQLYYGQLHSLCLTREGHDVKINNLINERINYINTYTSASISRYNNAKKDMDEAAVNMATYESILSQVNIMIPTLQSTQASHIQFHTQDQADFNWWQGRYNDLSQRITAASQGTASNFATQVSRNNGGVHNVVPGTRYMVIVSGIFRFTGTGNRQNGTYEVVDVGTGTLLCNVTARNVNQPDGDMLTSFLGGFTAISSQIICRVDGHAAIQVITASF